MREGWEYKKLGEVGKVLTGSTPSTKDPENYDSHDYCFVKPSDIPNNGTSVLVSTEFYISKKAFSCSRKLPKGSVLTTCIGIIGKVGILDIEATCNQQINAIIPFPNIILSSFLAYSILSKRSFLEKKSNAPVVPIINKKEFSNTIIGVPPLSEQQRIVEELDLLSSIIEKKKAQLKELDSLAQSIFYDMFGDPVTNEKGWEMKKLSTVCDVRDGTHDSPKYVDKGYPLITSKNVVNGTLSFENVNFITEKDLNAINVRSKVDDGDIIMPMIGTIGKPVIVKKIREFAIKNVALIKFSESKNVLNVYIQKLLDNRTYSFFLKGLNQGVTQKFVSLKTIRQLPIPLPPLPLQQQFAEKVEAIEHQKELIKQSIKEVETLFNSRMDYYFDG